MGSSAGLSTVPPQQGPVSPGSLQVGVLGRQLDAPATWRGVLPSEVRGGRWGRAAAPSRTPGPGEPGRGAQRPCVLSRDVIHIVFSSSSLRSWSSILTLHRQEVPAFVSEVLLEGSLPTILGDLGGPDGEGTVRTPCLGSGGAEPASSPPRAPEPPGCASTSGHGGSDGRVSSPARSTCCVVTCPEWCWALAWVWR